VRFEPTIFWSVAVDLYIYDYRLWYPISAIQGPILLNHSKYIILLSYLPALSNLQKLTLINTVLSKMLLLC